MRVLVACEYSGRVRDAFTALGHDAWSCDLLPTESPGNHIQGDVLKILGDGWDLMVAHPPCTRLAKSGVRWLHERNLWDEMREAALFFKALLNADIPQIAVENPVMHRYAVEVIGRKHNQVIHPWQFGHGETKATCLWLKGLPPLSATQIVAGREARIHRMKPGKERSKLRSLTYSGIAAALAAQWGIREPVIIQLPLFTFESEVA